MVYRPENFRMEKLVQALRDGNWAFKAVDGKSIAIGLNTSLVDFKKAGLAPMYYGVTIDTLVTLTALGVIWCMGLM